MMGILKKQGDEGDKTSMLSREISIFSIRSRDGVPPAAVQGTIRKGRITKSWRGPKKGEYIANPVPLKPIVVGDTKDGWRAVGNLIIAYDFNTDQYPRGMIGNSVYLKQLEQEFGQEISYDISGLLRKYEHNEVGTEKPKLDLEAAIKASMASTFNYKGLRVRKITSYWRTYQQDSKSKKPDKDIGMYLDIASSYFNSEIEEILDFAIYGPMSKGKISESVRAAIRKRASETVGILSKYGPVSEIDKQAMKTALFRAYVRAIKEPGKKLTEYVPVSEFQKIREKLYSEQQAKALPTLETLIRGV